jgi:hypothetical protein
MVFEHAATIPGPAIALTMRRHRQGSVCRDRPLLLLFTVGCLASCKESSSGYRDGGPNGGSGMEETGGGNGGVGGHGTGGMSTGGSGGGTIGGTALVPPVEITRIMVPHIRAAWPVGEWADTDAPSVFLDCGNGFERVDSQRYQVTITAGAGTSYIVHSTYDYPLKICDLDRELSADGLFIDGSGTSCPYTTAKGEAATMVADAFRIELTSEGSELRARVYGRGRITTPTLTCTYRIDDLVIRTSARSLGDVADTATAVTLATPLRLRGWGNFAVDGMGFGRTDETTYRRRLSVADAGSMPPGIVLDQDAWAVKVAPDALGFLVMLGFGNQGTTAVCMGFLGIDSVINAANLPLQPRSPYHMVAPSYGSSGFCLRPGERGWLVAAFDVGSDAAAFGNAAVVKLAAPPQSGIWNMAYAKPATPYEVAYAPGAGLHVKMVNQPRSVRVVFLDGGGLPLGYDAASSSIPGATVAGENGVFTYSFAEPAVLGSATTVLVYESDLWTDT